MFNNYNYNTELMHTEAFGSGDKALHNAITYIKPDDQCMLSNIVQ